MSWLLALSIQAATASPVVLHQGNEDSVRRAVAEAANIQPGELTLTHFDVFRTSTQSIWSGQVPLVPCGGDTVSMEDIAMEVSIAESRLMYMELEAAKTILMKAQSDLLCADSLIEQSVAARIGFLQGVISTAEDKGNDAWKSFTFAARFDPEVEWDEQYPDDGKGTLNGAKNALASSERIEVGVVPSFSIDPASPNVFLNAKPVTTSSAGFSAPVGTNLLQIQTDNGLLGFNVEVESDTGQELFIPQLLAKDSLSQMTSEEGRQSFMSVVNKAYDAGTLVFVAHEDGIWRTASGMDDWDTLIVSPNAPVVRGGGVPTMAWVGTGLTASALGGTIFALVKAVQNASASYPSTAMDQAASTGNSGAANTAHEEWLQKRQSAVGYSVGAGVGAALTATGFILTVPLF